MLSMHRKSQSAIEYVVTYGWAILIISVVAVVLWSFGVFNPLASTSTSVIGFSDFQVIPICVANGYLLLSISNELGNSVNLSSVNVTTNTGSKITVNTNTIIAPDNTYTAIVPSACPSAGSRYGLSAVLTYYPSLRSFGPQFSSGTLSGLVSGSSVVNITEVGLPSGTTWSIGSVSSISNSIIALTGTPINNVSIGGVTYYPLIYSAPPGYFSRYVTFLPDSKHRPVFVSGGNKVAVVNASTGTLIKNITTGESTSNIFVVISSTAPVGYETGGPGSAAGIAVFSTTNYSAIKNISNIPMNWGSITISPNGKWLYYANQGNAIYVISTSNNSLMTAKNITNPNFNGIIGVVFTPDGKYMFVNNNFAGDVLEMYSNGTYIKTITSGCISNPYGFAMSPDGKYLFVANANTGCLVVIDAVKGTVTTTISSGGTYAIGVVSDDSTLYVGGPSTLAKDSYSALLTGVSTSAYDVATSPDSKLIYVTNGGSLKSIQIINNTATPGIWKTVSLGIAGGLLSNAPYDNYW